MPNPNDLDPPAMTERERLDKRRFEAGFVFETMPEPHPGDGEINPMAEDTCPVCHGSLMIVVAGPDYFGNYDTTDCPCQTDPDFDPADYEREDDYP